MKPILYTNGDSVVWGAELENKEKERFSNLVCDKLGMFDCNNASSGVSNDYIYRQTMRDVSYWLETQKCWSEETGWIKSDELIVIIGWTSPTRFEWWNGKEYQQERLWAGYDKWGDKDNDKNTEDEFVLNQTQDIPSYIKTFNHIIGLSTFLDFHEIPYIFSNVFYEYNLNLDVHTKIDKFGREENQLALNSLWEQLPYDFKEFNLYSYIKENGGDFLPRKHPSKNSHKIISELLLKKIDGFI